MDYSTKTMNNCQAGHTSHDTKLVPTSEGEMVVFDWEKYEDFNGYCPGQDDVSRTLDKYGVWDLLQSNLLEYILSDKDGGVFIDVGAHIGWFSRLALRKGYVVHAYEGELEMNRLLAMNARKAIQHDIWFDEHLEPEKTLFDVRVKAMKIDIEGSERFAIQYFHELIIKQMVDNILMEVSPCFNSSYPALIKQLSDIGYTVKEITGRPFDFDYNFNQKDLWLHL